MRARPVGIAGLLALTLGLAGCMALADEMRDASDEELAEAGVVEPTGIWQSAPAVRSLWITLPSYAYVRVPHDLGREPVMVVPYLSYVKDDRKKSGERTYSVGAGDIATISNVTDESVTIQNRTYAEFYTRIVLQ